MRKGQKTFMKKKNLAALLVMMASCVAACGEKNEVADAGPAAGNSAYVYTQEQINLNGDIETNSLSVEGNSIYYFQAGDGAERKDCFVCLDLEKQETAPHCLYEAANDNTEKEGYENKTVKMFYGWNKEVIVITRQSPVIDEETASEADWRKWYLECSYVMKKIAEDGKEVFSVDITGYILSDTKAPYLQHAFADGEGRLFLTNGISRVWIFDGDGRYLHDIKLQENLLLGKYLKFGILGDGRAVIGTDADEGRSMNFVAYNVEKKDFTEVYTNLPLSLWGTEIVKGPNGGTLCYERQTVYEYDCETQTYGKILNWDECGIEGEYVRYAAALQNGDIIILYDDGNGQREWILLKRTEVGENDKTILTLARIPQDYEKFQPWELESEVIKFNLENETYRIEVKEYQDAEAFYYDILTGNVPDMFDPEGINMRLLAAKGVIEDMNPYLENSSIMKREDLFESVLNAYTINGILCSIPTGFWIETLFGKSSEVGEQTGWTVEEMLALVEEHEDKSLFAYEDREQILYFFIKYSSDAYVDWENGKCYFDSEEFCNILELASRYGEYEGGVSESEALSEGKALLCRYLITEPSDWQILEQVFGGPVTAVGFPGKEGTTVVMGIDEICICAGSTNKEGAWCFVESLLAGGWSGSNLPIRRSDYDVMIKDAIKPQYLCDEAGNVIYDERGIPVVAIGFWESWEYMTYAATEEEIDSLTGLIDRVDGIMDFDSQLYQIILEEAAPFFEGQKTAKEAAEIIQGRAEVFVKESIK